MGKDTEKHIVRYGHTWRLRENYSKYWVSTQGRPVCIFPPFNDAEEWLVVDGFGKSHRLTGDDAEGRAFAIAEGFTRQSSLGSVK